MLTHAPGLTALDTPSGDLTHGIGAEAARMPRVNLATRMPRVKAPDMPRVKSRDTRHRGRGRGWQRQRQWVAEGGRGSGWQRQWVAEAEGGRGREWQRQRVAEAEGHVISTSWNTQERGMVVGVCEGGRVADPVSSLGKSEICAPHCWV